ncbi:MAG: CRISPR-associated endonuclease Cas1 [Acidobacteria bacterium]|nr:CRISPR-associated endonuclease Cas1 [Acidobacteriota bacterium]
MHPQDISQAPPLPNGTYVVEGWGIRIHVYKRHLIVEDGTGPDRRVHRFHKATTDLKRLVILGVSGYVSLEAVRWLADAGVALTQIDSDQRLLLASQPMGSDRAGLRRAQAWAMTNETGLRVTRYLLDRKLEGQAHIAAQLGGSRTEIDEANRQVEKVDSLDELMWLEAQAANHYWYAWADVECRFVTRDQTSVPDHWRRFGKRGSGFNSSGPRGAANPINAILNYLYALLEAETVIACQVVGLDPGMGVLHADQRGRDSFALDLMEPVRPLVDQWVLRRLSQHRFKASDFADTRRGICRLKPAITHWLADTTREWADAVGPHAEHVAKMLASTPGVRVDRIPTPLTGENRSLGRPPKRPKPTVDPTRPSHCHTCGGPVDQNRTQCDACLPTFQASHLEEMISGAHQRLQQLRSDGLDPAHGGTAAAQRGQANRIHQLVVHQWNQENESRPSSYFTEKILPRLQTVSLSVMAEATGLSKGYCSFIKRGIKTPHERHWPALRILGEAT